MGTLLGQVVAPARVWTFGDILIALVIVLACVGIVYVATQAFGVPIPKWLIKIVLICVVAVVAILAIRFVLSL